MALGGAASGPWCQNTPAGVTDHPSETAARPGRFAWKRLRLRAMGESLAPAYAQHAPELSPDICDGAGFNAPPCRACTLARIRAPRLTASRPIRPPNYSDVAPRVRRAELRPGAVPARGISREARSESRDPRWG